MEPNTAASGVRSGAMTVTYYVALPFIRADDGTIALGEAIECRNGGAAIHRAGLGDLERPSGELRPCANFLDTASIAQSLDGERLMGCLHCRVRNDIP
jgi:hypothetical protein